MANWIHRTNGTYLKSQDPPVGDQASWLRLGSDTLESLLGAGTVPADVEVVGDVVQLRPLVTRLNRLRLRMAFAVRQNTANLRAAGFTYSAKTFGLTSEDVAELQDLKARGASLTWPLVMDTADGLDSVSLANATEGLAFYDAAFDRLKALRNGERSLLAQIRAASSVAELAAITDSRT